MPISPIMLQFNEYLASLLIDIIVGELKRNQNDFVYTLTKYIMDNNDTGSILDVEKVKSDAESLFLLYIDSIKYDGRNFGIQDKVHDKTGMSVLKAAKIYEYGAGDVPAKMIWRKLPENERVLQLQKEANSEVINEFIRIRQ